MDNRILLAIFLLVIGNIFGWLQINLHLVSKIWIGKPIPSILILSIPIGCCFYFAWASLVDFYDNSLWSARLVSFGVGVIIFALMAYFIKGEVMSKKNWICFFLSILIVLIQSFWPSEKPCLNNENSLGAERKSGEEKS
jgi:hypothetical protein